MVEKNTFTPNENRNRSTVHGRKKNVEQYRYGTYYCKFKISSILPCVRNTNYYRNYIYSTCFSLKILDVCHALTLNYENGSSIIVCLNKVNRLSFVAVLKWLHTGVPPATSGPQAANRRR